MNTIPVRPADLLAKLEENKIKHESEYESARAAWVAECTTALLEAAEKASSVGIITKNPLSDLPEPKRYSREYDNAIERVEWYQGDVIELDDRQFAAWIQDNWDWSAGFLANTTQYRVSQGL